MKNNNPRHAIHTYFTPICRVRLYLLLSHLGVSINLIGVFIAEKGDKIFRNKKIKRGILENELKIELKREVWKMK